MYCKSNKYYSYFVTGTNAHCQGKVFNNSVCSVYVYDHNYAAHELVQRADKTVI